MKKRITNIKTFGKIISKSTDKRSFPEVVCCTNVRVCRRFTVLKTNAINIDGNNYCEECASKLINQDSIVS